MAIGRERRPEKFKGTGIIVHEHENISQEAFENAIRRFRRIVENDNTLGDYAKHESFMKPSVKKRLKLLEAKKRQRDLTRFERKSDDKQINYEKKQQRERRPQTQKATSPSFVFNINVNPTRRDFSQMLGTAINIIHLFKG